MEGNHVHRINVPEAHMKMKAVILYVLQDT